MYVAWHPEYAEGKTIGDSIYAHFRRDIYKNAGGGGGINVLFRSASVKGSRAPLPINLGATSTSVVIVLLDEKAKIDSDWRDWFEQLLVQADASQLSALVIPVVIDKEIIKWGFPQQAVRWDKDPASDAQKVSTLIFDITYQTCRLLRLHLAHLAHPAMSTEEELEEYLKKVRVFLSHSKHDPLGEKLALELKDAMTTEGLSTFFDVYDIPAGTRFDKVILHRVKTSSVIALHTDSYSSREWCRKEMIEAKQNQSPLIVANCIDTIDERCFPYLGNVPVVRLHQYSSAEFRNLIGHLLDETLKDFVWKCRIFGLAPANTTFLPRTPELICLATIGSLSVDHLIVYPDPPIGAEEEELFAKIAPKITLRSFTEWSAAV
jgi:TIR domain